METKKIAGVRIHIERVNQRIEIYRILSKIPTTELSYVDNIVFMACVINKIIWISVIEIKISG